MKVRAVKSFVEEGVIKHRIEQDAEFELPEGCEHWLDLGFVVPAREIEIKTATVKPKEKAVTRSRSKKAIDKVMGIGKKK